MARKTIQKTIPLEEETMERLKQIAEELGVAPATVGRMAIRKYLGELNEKRSEQAPTKHSS